MTTYERRPVLSTETIDPGEKSLTPGDSSVRPETLRILQVTPRYFPYTGGVESHVFQVSRRLAKAGIDVTVLTTDLSGELPPSEESEGVKIIRVRAFPRRRDYYFAPDIYRTILEGAWDIVHLQSYHTLVAPLAMLAARHAGLPFVVTFHGGGHSSRIRRRLRRIQIAALRPSLSRAKRLVALTEFEVNFFSKKLRLPRERFVIIPNGADLPEPAAPVANASPGTLIASIGRLERYKGHQRVISALPFILEKRPDARLWIAGTGPYEANLRRLAEKLGLAGRVEIRAIPASKRAQMAAELQRANLVMLLSEYETHPIAILEALALGRPVLVADNSGMCELARKGWARAIPLQSSPEQVAAAALEQLDRPPAAKFVLPDWDTCAGALLCLYQTCAWSKECAF